MVLNVDQLQVFRIYWDTISDDIVSTTRDKGWNTADDEARKIALMHAELSEALEAYRVGNPPSEHTPAFSAVEEEFADLLIRMMAHAKVKGYDIPGALLAKMKYNKTRPYKHGGKKY